MCAAKSGTFRAINAGAAITAPTNNAAFPPAANIPITVAASDADGTVVSIKPLKPLTQLPTV